MSAVLPFSSTAVIYAQTGPPAPAEQDRMLDAMHQYGERYVSNLPNFLCVQVTRQLEADKKSNRWHRGDTLTSTLAFEKGRERRRVELVNGKPVQPGQMWWHTPLTTEGEFGILISRVLGPDSDASFTWNRWETVRGKRLAVFDFSVDKQHSTLSLSLSNLVKAVVPYCGSVYADPATGTVWRIMDSASEIPPALATREISTTVDYGEVTIGDKNYLLPFEATVLLLLERKKIRNELEFRDYRKFEADSAITFGPMEPGDNPTTKPGNRPAAPKR